jgi:predicted DNA-binding ribbon-helix-helix protein
MQPTWGTKMQPDVKNQISKNKTSLISKNVTIHGKRTSVRLEPEMWQAINEIAKRQRCTIHRICSIVQDTKAPKSSLTAAIRVFIMSYFRAAATEEGHIRVGHGSNFTRNMEDMKIRPPSKKCTNMNNFIQDRNQTELQRHAV